MNKKGTLRRRITSVLLACAMMLGTASAVSAAEMNVEETPTTAECLTLAPGRDTTELYVTWYADADTTQAQVRMADQLVTAEVTPASEGKVSCRAVVGGLTPGETYAYQVSDDDGATWSEAYSYNCPDEGAFTFGYVGDPQLNYKRADATEGWQASVKAMADAGVDFIASVGDNTDTTSGREDEYANFFAPEELRSIPYAPCVGNHDRNAMFSYHFSYPNAVEFIGENPTSTSGQTAAAETVGNYYYLYNNALFVVLNDAGYPANVDQAKVFIDTFDATFRAATEQYAGQYDWLFVQHHKSTESVAGHVADSDIQYYVEAGFEKLMDRYDVDFVLAGHDHVYVRSYIMKDGKRAQVQGTEVNNADGTVYFTANTASGLKYYALASANPNKTEYPYLADGSVGMANYGPDNLALGVATWSQLETPGYTIVNVTDKRVTFNSYGVQDPQTSIDALTITKGAPAAEVALTGEAEVTVDDALSYTVTAANVEALTTASIRVAIPAEPELIPAEGWYMIAKSYDDGVLTMLLGNNAGVTSEGTTPLVTLKAENPGQTGTYTAELLEATLSGYEGEGEAYIDVTYGGTTVETVITYSVYDVNEDGVVDQLDITRAQRFYGTANARCDVNGDGEVNIADLILIMNNYSR